MRLPLVADGELLPPPRPAAGEHRAPILRGHADPEPVRLGTMAVIRLKGTFRHLIPISKYKALNVRGQSGVRMAAGFEKSHPRPRIHTIVN